MAGYIFCLTNDAFPGKTYVGAGDTPALEHIKSIALMIPSAFHVTFERKVDNYDKIAKMVALALGVGESKRVWFDIDTERIERVVAHMVDANAILRSRDDDSSSSSESDYTDAETDDDDDKDAPKMVDRWRQERKKYIPIGSSIRHIRNKDAWVGIFDGQNIVCDGIAYASPNAFMVAHLKKLRVENPRCGEPLKCVQMRTEDGSWIPIAQANKVHIISGITHLFFASMEQIELRARNQLFR